MTNSQLEEMNEWLHPHVLIAALLEILGDRALQRLRDDIPDNTPVLEEYERRGLHLNSTRPQPVALLFEGARRLQTSVITANTPSLFSAANVPELALPEPSTPYGRTNALGNYRHGLSRAQSIEERTRWAAEFSDDLTFNPWDESAAFESGHTFPRGEDHEAQARLRSQHEAGPSGTYTASPSSEPQLGGFEEGAGSSSHENYAQSGSGTNLQVELGSNDIPEDSSEDSTGFGLTNMPAPRATSFIPSLPSIREEEAAVEYPDDSNFSDAETAVEVSEDSDSGLSWLGDGDGGYGEATVGYPDETYFADSDETAVENSEDSDSRFDEVNLLGDSQIDDDDNDQNTYWVYPPPQSLEEYYGQPPQNPHVGPAALPEYTSPYGVSVTVQEIPEEELSDAETEAGEDGANTPLALPSTEVDAEEELASMHSNVNRQFREQTEDGAEVVLGYAGGEGQWQFIDRADGEVEFLPNGYDIDGEGTRRTTRSQRVRLRSWNGLLRTGTRNPSPVTDGNNSRRSSIRRSLGTVVDKAKKLFRK